MPGFSFAPELGLWHELVILHALDIADGTQPTGVPVAFGQLTDGLARGSDFDRRATSAFKGFLAADDRDASGFLSACDSLGAKRIDSKADVGLVLHLLPCYPIYLNVWLADEEFPASAKLMVDAASDHILTLEDAVTVGELLLGLLSDALSPRVTSPGGVCFASGAGKHIKRVGSIQMTQGTGIANLAGEMIDFIAESPTMFHSTLQIESMLSGGEAMTHLDEAECWSIEPGRGYVVTRGGSSLVAFKVGRRCLDVSSGGLRFQIVAVHADFPAFKLKNVSEAEGPEGYLRLDVEAYGGMIDRTWFDRPLAIAGRVLVREDDRIESRLVDTTGAVAIIPSLAIHLDRESNSGFSPNRNVDLRPIISAGELGSGSIDVTLAESIGVESGQIVSRDLFVYNNQPGMVWGISREFLSSPRIDDLAGAYCAAKAFGNTLNDSCVTVLACFDNEEVGSNTKQGAMSTFLRDTLSRVTACLCGEGAQELPRALSRSMLVSCDNAHAVHPNHPEKHDELNRARLNGGIVVKEAANQRYCTDAFSRAIFQTVCERAGVSFQTFANRSDMAGGSTLGNLSNIQVSMHAVDVGIPQLAMHSAFETMGARDVENTVAALEAFYAADIRIDGASSVEIR